ncbi:uncharacterized protein LOC127701314 [Mytilus californianus]|uniref:uncharacterized protein LOC127701314 n=1 Tax=Mytilus californianus TaxID=6549 RepID=UPI0022486C45|nr:uncharacterized protein LOC127701314 [Mytilus californianus]
MRDHFEERTGKKIILKHISNIVNKVNKTKKTDNLEKLVQKLKVTGSEVEIFHDGDSNLQALFYQDAEMQRVFATFPEIIFVDATYKLNDRRMPFYVMMVEDSLGQSEVAAIALVNSEERAVLQQLIHCFKENNQAAGKTKVIMADKDINERDVFKSELPNAMLLICQFHVLRSFNREITTEKMGISSAQRHTALELLQKLVYCNSETDYEASLEEVKRKCSRQINEYIINNWHEIRHEWVFGLKLCDGSLMNTTNNRLESFNQKLKQVINLYSCLEVFFEKFLSLINTVRNERDHKGSVEVMKVSVRTACLNSESAEVKYLNHLTGYACKFVLQQLSKAKQITNLNGTSTDSRLMDDEIELCTESCNCNVNKSMGLPCKHIFKLYIISWTFLQILLDLTTYVLNKPGSYLEFF